MQHSHPGPPDAATPVHHPATHPRIRWGLVVNIGVILTLGILLLITPGSTGGTASVRMAGICGLCVLAASYLLVDEARPGYRVTRWGRAHRWSVYLVAAVIVGSTVITLWGRA